MAFPWLEVVADAVRRWSTPFYIQAWEPVLSAYGELSPLSKLNIQVRHWVSVKTQTVKPLLIAYRERLGMGAEVISLNELLAARATGFFPENIIVNGPAKHSWLPKELRGLNVHFDSLGEIEGLGSEQLRLHKLGVRCQVETGHNPKDPTLGGQFGLTEGELVQSTERLRRSGLAIDGLHFHLRSNIRDPQEYVDAMKRALAMGARAGIKPTYVDLGGGFPVPGEGTYEYWGLKSDPLSIEALADQLSALLKLHPTIKELWLENGRFLSARSAVLVFKVLDIKDRPGCRFLLCDGGRTNNALPNDWEEHAIATIPGRSGRPVPTRLVGPTCTAHDRLRCRELPIDVSVGDYIIYFNAGAYHLSWETRFSQGLAKLIWCDERMRLTLARRAENFDAWWGLWN